MKNKPVTVLLLVVIVATWIVFMVLTSVRAEGAAYLPRDQYPKIPRCEKELWERITEGCDE